MLMRLAILVLGAASAAVTCAKPAPRCVTTWGGSKISGQETDGVCRYTVRYAQAARWGNSVPVQSSTDASEMPLACPQRETPFSQNSEGVHRGQSEDCLFAVIYTPKNARGLPVLTWVHGGGGELGWAGYPGVDGSHLARNGRMVVVVPQYRLGSFGFLPPPQAATAHDPNLAVGDILVALQQIQNHIGSFGGDRSRVTLAGHSSGGQIVRALLSSPDAVDLFHRAVLQSDPLMYGLSSTRLTGDMQRYMSSLLMQSNMAGLLNVPTADVLAAQANLTGAVHANVFQGVPNQQIFRPTTGTASVPNDPSSSIFYNPGALASKPSDIPLLITTTANEGGDLVHSVLSNPVPLAHGMPVMGAVMTAHVGPERAAALLSTAPYALPATSDNPDVVRAHLERAVTDVGWRCVARAMAQRWAAAGGRAYIGEWNKGSTFPNNRGASTCNTGVCHQDDIFPTFGTGPVDPEFQAEVLELWASFVHTGRPVNWRKFPQDGDLSGKGVHAIGGGTVPACPENFYDITFKWDWQMHN